MLREMELPIISMFATYVVVAFHLTAHNYNQVFYVGIDVMKCSRVANEINAAHKRANDDFRVEHMSLQYYLERVFEMGFKRGRNTTAELEGDDKQC